MAIRDVINLTRERGRGRAGGQVRSKFVPDGQQSRGRHQSGFGFRSFSVISSTHAVLGGLLARPLARSVGRPDLVNPPEAGRRAQEAGRQETGHFLRPSVRPFGRSGMRNSFYVPPNNL